ncbi:N-acetylglucosamine-6-phosphate deacetylase [Tengunoibacter tsumagoiensis]|uniref:N-acetylglucosamine-6-phosphate deacetylase n=1 Tax=Tengunoibacter tsumagoiensis TaxID=2014871 RepID=A0A402A6F5_9CHLR|nr:N-acetylglucosamine-6-phosphate deacetylase [Tengunoibacter tsumagoiensis]GCE14727.1 N-acetylglucosamine-6-phosphate deacetylase [Tengunoibacter tsumagoiensis]
MQFTLHGAHLVDAQRDQRTGSVCVTEGTIRSVGPVDEPEGVIIDASDAVIMPGFIEVHTHGGGGFSLHTTHVEELQSYAQWITSTGVTSFLVAVVGTPASLPEAQLATAVDFIEQRHSHLEAEPVGIFLEGPYINEKRRGAHPPIWLRTPDESETEQVLALTKGYLKLITIAPELPGAQAMLQRLIEAGVTVSIGHTDADYEQAQQAIQQGARHMTHCFNAMRPLHHRKPGPLAALAQHAETMGELIADGVHVHPAMMDLLVKVLSPQRTVIITDAQSCAGNPEGEFDFAGQAASVINGAAFLSDGTLAGSVLTMDQALRNILQYTHVSLSEAVGMLTYNPARTAQVDKRKGLLAAGYDADLLIFDQSLHLQATICRGEVAFATEEWSQRLQSLKG